MDDKNKLNFTKRKAFTLIELLIVIAIIGILFIVLVSKVDFATDKAKASGVQTDFRSFQMAFDTVAKENAGFNTFGWDTGDANQNGKRDSYDECDNGAGGGIAKNGIQDGDEVFTGHKVYAETFTKVFSLKKNGTGDYDRDALNRLETAINANLDPKLHITIKDDGEIVMANGAKDPWNKEYHGWYITNAEVDKKDRGAIVMYSDGANNEFGSEHKIANGVVTVSIPGSNKAGKDDYSLVSCYTYVNGYGEVLNITTGFSNNQGFLTGNNISNNVPDLPENETPDNPDIPEDPENNETLGTATFIDGVTLTWDELMLEENGTKYGYDASKITTDTIGQAVFSDNQNLQAIVIPTTITTIGSDAFYKTTNLKSVEFGNNSMLTKISSFAFQASGIINISMPNGITSMGQYVFYQCPNLETIRLPDISVLGKYACYQCPNLKTVIIPSSVTKLTYGAFADCSNLETVIFEENSQLTDIDDFAFDDCSKLTNIDIPKGVVRIGVAAFQNSGVVNVNIPQDSQLEIVKQNAFNGCKQLTKLNFPSTLTTIETVAFRNCHSLTECTFGENSQLTNIGDSAFIVCKSLNTITIPKNVSNMFDDQMFQQCTNLTYIEVEEGNTVYKSIDGILYSYDTTTLIEYPSGRTDTTFVVPSFVTYIYGRAFDYALNLNEIVLHDNITKIDKKAFSDSNISQLILPANLTEMGQAMAQVCPNLTYVEFNNPTGAIGQSIFYNCTQLTTIKFNGTVAEWNALTKGKQWNYNVPATHVICLDGNVAL